MLQDFEHNGVRMNLEVTGEGNPLILMHGWGCNHTTVQSIAATAAQTHKVYNVDFPGFGKSTEPKEVWGVEEYTQLIEAFVKSEGIENPVLVGHSFGGRVAILYASRNQVDKVVLVDAAGIKPKFELKKFMKTRIFKTARVSLEFTMGKDRAKPLVDNLRKFFGSSDYANAAPMMRAILSKVVNEDLTDRLPLIKAPSLMIWGEKDTATPLSDAKLMNKLIPDSGLVSFPNCGHYSFLENPAQFRAVLSSFLKS